MIDFQVIIPARYESSRLPGKVLKEIAGKPMIQHVYESALKSGAEQVVIATDNDRVLRVAEDFGAIVCMTSADHLSGTERLAEAVVALGLEEDQPVVCLQADEPMMSPTIIRQVAEDLVEHGNVKITSVCAPIQSEEELFDANTVKVVLNHRHYALYFSRAPIPWDRDNFSFHEKNSALNVNPYFRHIGIYAYRAGFLQDYVGWDPCFAEKNEKLEQLRILWNGGRIHMVIAQKDVPRGIDIPADLERVKAYFK